MNDAGDARDEARATGVDLSACDREPIHMPGAIQAHGVLLALQERDLSPVHAAANCGDHLGVSAGELLGRPLRATLGTDTEAGVRRLLAEHDGDGGDPCVLEVAGRSWDAIWYRSGGLTVVELEPAAEPGDGGDSAVLLRALRRAVERLRDTEDPDRLHLAKAEEMRRLTGFDRVMIYRFHEDDHGEVIAEARAAGTHSYLGHHFPAGDIPVQARRLYALNPIRGVADALEEPVPLVGLAGAEATALDMTYSALRSLSPVHREYLRNMGVAASMSLSLMHDGRLWGLIACHHLTPLRVGAHVRTACRMLAEVGAMQLAAGDSARAAARRERLAALKRDLAAGVLGADSLARAVVGPSLGMTRAVRADGIAAYIDGEVATAGAAPAADRIPALIQGLDPPPATGGAAAHDDLAITAADDGGLLPGMLVVALPGAGDDAVLWFRRERARRIAWAGDPEVPALPDASDAGALRPRRSFAAFMQEIRGRSEPWAEEDVEAARSIGRGLAEAMLTRARERLAYLGQHDALTGLANRHLFDRLLADALDRAEAAGKPVAVLFVDLDRFKDVNDRLGHSAGDDLLRQAAERLHAAIRASDVAARVGGDEFVVLCEDITPQQARQVADRVASAFTDPFPLGDEAVTVTASVGLEISRPGMDARRLVGNADEAMYRAKRAGRTPAR